MHEVAPAVLWRRAHLFGRANIDKIMEEIMKDKNK